MPAGLTLVMRYGVLAMVIVSLWVAPALHGKALARPLSGDKTVVVGFQLRSSGFAAARTAVEEELAKIATLAKEAGFSIGEAENRYYNINASDGVYYVTGGVHYRFKDAATADRFSEEMKKHGYQLSETIRCG